MTPSVYPTMEEYYSQDRLRTIWEEVDNLHRSYLEMEDSPMKFLKRNELEDAINQFLSIVPHNQKFLFAETANVLYKSASSKKDFSGYRAALGWNAIALYAANLWTQPWRNEYKQIKLYSGYYKHQIDANLVGAEKMFELMGYQNDGNGILTLVDPICPDRILGVSQDALLAYVECQVLKAIWEDVSSTFKISWLEVLEFRRSHLCSIKQSIQALSYRCNERQFQQHVRSHSQGTDVRYCSASATLPTNHSFPPLYSQPLPCFYSNGYHPDDYTSHPHHYQLHHTCAPPTYAHTVKPIYSSNCCHPNGYSVPIQSAPQVCPTGQLIEVESQHCDGSNKSPVSTNGESWDYVYKDLENQGYTKDLGERGDLLSTPLNKEIKAPIKEAKKVKAHHVNNFDKTLGSLSLNVKKPPNSVNGFPHNTSETKNFANGLHTKTNNTKTMVSKATSTKSDDKRSPKSSLEVLSKWECTACTYLNDPKQAICEMCSKSKIMVSDEMEIGGSQCSKCTLVNPKDNTECKACSSSLKGSPTYI